MYEFALQKPESEYKYVQMCTEIWEDPDEVLLFKTFVSEGRGYGIYIDDDLPAALITPSGVVYDSLIPLGFQTQYVKSKNSVAIYNHLHFKILLKTEGE
jgi:hypothetical protein